MPHERCTVTARLAGPCASCRQPAWPAHVRGLLIYCEACCGCAPRAAAPGRKKPAPATMPWRRIEDRPKTGPKPAFPRALAHRWRGGRPRIPPKGRRAILGRWRPYAGHCARRSPRRCRRCRPGLPPAGGTTWPPPMPPQARAWPHCRPRALCRPRPDAAQPSLGRRSRQKHFFAGMFRLQSHQELEGYVNQADFELELQRIAEAEYQAWRDYSLRRAELEAAKAEAAEALLDGDTPAARKRFNEATQAIALLEASLIAARHRREKLFATYCEARITELRTRARDLREQAKLIDEERRKILAEIEKLEEVQLLDPPHTKLGAPRKTDLLRQQAEDLLGAAARLERAGIPRAGVARGSNLDELLMAMLRDRSIPPTCEAVAQWYQALAGAVPRGQTVKFARIAWHHSRLVRDSSYLETDHRYWLYMHNDGSIEQQQATKPLAELPPPGWLLHQAWYYAALSK